MLCKIADLLVKVPEAGGMASRCREYLYASKEAPDIVICEEKYRTERYPEMPSETIAYMESARQFNALLINHNGFYLHSSAVEVDGKAYLFSANSGVGKSTHTQLWQQILGEKAIVFNDDKPALRYIDNIWYAYGTPWCGKDGINSNRKVPVAGICFLKQGEENHIRRMSEREAVTSLLSQTVRKFKSIQYLDQLSVHLSRLISSVPIYELTNLPEPAAAWLSYETMRRSAEEAGL